MNLEQLLAAPSLPAEEKERHLLAGLNQLIEHHRRHCADYQRLLGVLYPDLNEAATLEQVPFLPVGLFKSHRLLSVPEEQVFKVLTSSGTTGERVSQVFLDRTTAEVQSRALARIMTGVLGPRRLPMLIVDSADTVARGSSMNARGAGILGMLTFGRAHRYALDSNMNLDIAGVEEFLARFGAEPFLIFGFTFMVWEYFFMPLEQRRVDLSQAVLVHTGGWKKLRDRAVSREIFRLRLGQATGLKRIHNFYGMAEQVGSVYIEDDEGYLRAPNFSEVLIRDPLTLELAPRGTAGIVQVLSLLPRSYPGHSILTEDLGVLRPTGPGFTLLGRIPRAELRGCSDVHAQSGGVS